MNRNKIFPNEPLSPRHVLERVKYKLPNGIERVGFIDSDSDIDPWAWEKFWYDYYKTTIDRHRRESEKKDDRRT